MIGEQIKANVVLNAAHHASHVASKIYLAEAPVAGALPTGEWMVIRANSDRVDPDYLHYSMVRPEGLAQIKYLVKGIHLYPRDVATIPLPPIEDQRRIVDILNRANGIRRLRRESLDKTRQLIPVLFVDVFGDLRQNEGTYTTRPLRDVAEIGSGITKGRKLEGEQLVEAPYIRVANVQDGFLNLEEIKHIPVRPSELVKYALKPGDLLMTEGGDPDKLGRAALWNDEVPTCVHQNHVFRVRAKPDLAEPLYLRALAGSLYGKQYFLRVAKRTTGIASINKTQLGNFRSCFHRLVRNAISLSVSPTSRPRSRSRSAWQKPAINWSPPSWRSFSTIRSPKCGPRDTPPVAIATAVE